MNSKYLFQFCPKICIFSKDLSAVLLCKRTGETDYDGVFSFIGGKMELSDSSITECIRRECAEEVGSDFRFNLLINHAINVEYKKIDGSHMILPHYFAVHREGGISLSGEYSEASWVSINSLAKFAPKIENISWIAPALLRSSKIALAEDFITL